MSKRLATKMLVSGLLLSLLLPSIVNAAGTTATTTGTSTGAATGTSPNSMTRSMISFFRTENTDLAVDRVARDEVLVYGVFLSNLFVPWQTTINDIIDNSTDNSIPKKLSTKFFGSTGKSDQVAELNKKLYEPISQVLGGDKKSWGLYSSAPKDTSTVMTGEDFFKMMSATEGKKKVYNASGKVVFDLDDTATHAAFQVLFGFAPDYMLSSSKGLRQLTGLYMDGLGNIWGSHGNADFSDYVLFMPSALNPIVFPPDAKGKPKFPVANVFSMGGTLKMTSNFLDGKPITTPYYNIKPFPESTKGPAQYNTSNMVTIFGIQSPTADYIGNSNAIRDGKAATSNPMEKIKSFLDQSTTDVVSESEAKVVLSVDASKGGDAKNSIATGNSLSSSERGNLINYLFTTSVFSLSQLSDDMYYFKVPTAQTQNASGGAEGTWSNDQDLMKKQKMFAKEVDGSPGQYQFYGSSYYSSPFNTFLHGYLKSDNKDQYLVDRMPSVNKVSNDPKWKPEITALKSFLETGSFGTEDSTVIDNVMKFFKLDSSLVYDTVEPSKDIVNIADSKFLFDLIDWHVTPTAFGLSANDYMLTVMSLAATSGNPFATYDGGSKAPFIKGNGGGHIGGVTKDNELSITNYFHNAYTYGIFSMNSIFTNELTGVKAGSTFKTPAFGADATLTSKTAMMNDVNNYPGMYWGYMVQLLNVHKDGDVWKNDNFSNDLLPYMNINTLGGGLNLNDIMGASGVVASDQKNMEEMQKDIVKKVYGLLSPGPNDYRDSLIKSAQDSWIISTHRSITGSWVGNVLSVSAGGSGSYASVVGFINTPSLGDLPLTSWILSDYMFVYMILLLVVLIVLILMVITNMRSLREGALIFIVMAFVLILPQFLVGNLINISNLTGDKIYSGRFNYWAITQQQQSLNNMKNSMLTNNEMDYTIAKNMENNKNAYSSDVGVRVKWMAPKRDDVFDQMFSSKSVSQSLQSNMAIFRWLFSSSVNQEQYVYNDPLATYLYRPYNAIASEASDSFDKLYKTQAQRQDIVSSINGVKSNVAGLPDNTFSLILNSEGKVKFSDEQKKIIEGASTYSFNKTDATKAPLENYRYWALNSADVTKAIFRSTYNTDHGYTGDTSNPYYTAYSLTTESPFYYFYNELKLRYTGVATDGKTDFKSALLSKDVFVVGDSTNKAVNGKVRDFLDLQGLFTYVIPYLQQGNNYVHGWTARYGSSIDSYNFKGGTPDSTDPLYNTFKEQAAKKDSLKNVWKLYAPWVDQMYSLDIANKKVRIADKTVQVDDALNPGTYDSAGRPMIFSEADMYSKSYRVSDLSDVEMRIQRTLDSTYRDMLYLANYYDFDNDVLLTAAAMEATFNFDREFSKQKLLGDSTMIYPQSFELKNFNYDAFMRLILLNATGEPLLADKDLYVRVLDKTSIFTGILLILSDLMAVMVIPTIKVMVLLLLLLLSIAISIACVITPPERIGKVITKNLLLPSVLFLFATAGFAFVISLFMGEGLTGYVGGRTPSVGVTDPTVTMGLMFIVDCVYLFILWKIAKLLFSSLKSNVTSSFFSTLALASGAGTSMLTGAMSRLKNGVAGGAGYLYRRNQRNKVINSFGGSADGGGSASSGVSSRGAGSRGGLGSSKKSSDASNASDQSRRKDPDFADYLDNRVKERSNNGKGRPVSTGSSPSPTEERMAKHGQRGKGRSVSYESSSNPKSRAGARPSTSMSDAQLRRLETRMSRQEQNSAKTFMHLNQGQNKIYSRVKKLEGKVSAVKRKIPKK